MYAVDEYWIKDEFDRCHKIEEVTRTSGGGEIKSLEVMVTEGHLRRNLRVDQAIVEDLDLEREEKLDLMLQEIIDDAVEEDEEDELNEED